MGKTVIWLAFILPVSLFGQVTLSGKVQDTNGQPLHSASVILQDSTRKMVAFDYTNKEGNYKLQFKGGTSFLLTVNSLGHKSQTIPLRMEEGKDISQNILLDKDAKELQEVVIKHVKPVSEDGDKVVFNAESFLLGNETVVEDLLKKIPGLNVSSDGTIRYGDQEVEKIMVEGDDFFEKGYKILTRNMPVNPVNKVELLRNYSNNKHLKGIENSRKVALNLTLKDNHKGRWFGNISGGIATKKRFEAKGNLMNFSKREKYYFLGDANNTGIDASGDIRHLIQPVKTGEPGDTGDNQTAQTLLNADFILPGLSTRKTKINHDQLLSLNGIFDITPKTKIKALLFAKKDRLDFSRNSYENYSVGNILFINTEQFTARKRLLNGFGKVDLSHDFSDKSTMEYIAKINKGETSLKNSSLFNEIPLESRLTGDHHLSDHKLLYTYKLNKRNVWVFTGRHLTEEKPQSLFVDYFLFNDLFTLNGSSSRQESNNRMQYTGVSAEWMSRGKNQGLFELKIGNEYRKDFLSSLFVINTDSASFLPENYQNNTRYTTADTYLSSSYRIKWRNTGITTAGDLHRLSNHLTNNQESEISQQLIFVNPKLSFDWQMQEKQKIRASYGLNTSNAKISDVYNGYIQTTYRTLSKGLGNFQQLNASVMTANYTYGSWSDNFFAFLSMIYMKNHDFLSTNSFISSSYSLSEKIRIKDREMLLFNAQTDFFITPLSSNLKLTSSYNKTNFKNVVNDSDLREVVNTSLNYGVELRSAFNGGFNYHIGTRWDTYSVRVFEASNRYTNNYSFLDLYFALGSKIDFKVQGESYYFANLQKGHRQFHFVDLEGKYRIKEAVLDN